MTATATSSAALDPLQWLDAHGDVLFAFARTRVGNPDTAEDLVQETLLAAWKAADSFAGQASERTWLVGILKNKVIDHLRKATRTQQVTVDIQTDEAWEDQFNHDEQWTDAPRQWDDPRRVLENQDLGAQMNDCLERLPENLRVVFSLREIDGLDTDEIVSTLNLSSANNLRVMLSRARDRMRQCIDKKWFQS